MRSDMQTVIIEKPRTGGHGARRNRKNDYLKDYREGREVTEPFRQGISVWAGWDTKALSDNLGPLWGFLHKRVGHRWDDVWSEVC